jgi:hypothetical protein
MKMPDFLSPFQHLRLAIQVTLGRKQKILLAADFFVLASMLVVFLLGGMHAETAYIGWVFLICLFGVPIVADGIEFERRCGTIDLVLALPQPGKYFIRRMTFFLCLLSIQGILMMIFVRLVFDQFPLWPVVLQGTVSTLLIGSFTLLASLVFRSTGAAVVVVLIGLTAISKWLFGNPVFGPQTMMFVTYKEFLSSYFQRMGLLSLCCVICIVYSRRMLSNPERLLR